MDLASWVGLGTGLISFCGGLVLWYKGSVEKRYAAQRDFGHLKRNYEQLTIGITDLTEEQEKSIREVLEEIRELQTEVREAKMMLNFLMSQLGGSSQGIPAANFYTNKMGDRSNQ